MTRSAAPRPPSGELTATQQAGLEQRQADQDQTLDAVHRLEAALSSAAFGREPAWFAEVSRALESLDAVTREEQRNASRLDSLLSDIAHTQPLLRNRVRGLRIAYRQLRDTIETLSMEMARGDGLDVAELRRRLAWLLTAVRHHRSRESDLLYEAYYEAFHRDLDDDAGRQR